MWKMSIKKCLQKVDNYKCKYALHVTETELCKQKFSDDGKRILMKFIQKKTFTQQKYGKKTLKNSTNHNFFLFYLSTSPN